MLLYFALSFLCCPKLPYITLSLPYVALIGTSVFALSCLTLPYVVLSYLKMAFIALKLGLEFRVWWVLCVGMGMRGGNENEGCEWE